jgi:hypothetical protein
MNEQREKCKELFQMRIGELEKRMDYKFEERMRRIEAVEEQFREKSKDHNEFLSRIRINNAGAWDY